MIGGDAFEFDEIAGRAAGSRWTELADAGPLPETAQETTGSGILNVITGELADNNDADMYLIRIADAANFSATASGGSLVDPQLFLFDVTGLGVFANDDILNATVRQSRLAAPSTPGLYYLVVTGWNNEPNSSAGNIFPDDVEGVLGPTGPGGMQPISGYANNQPNPDGVGTYRCYWPGRSSFRSLRSASGSPKLSWLFCW
jgi:hypothetical protein